jgi:hypothetical protein
MSWNEAFILALTFTSCSDNDDKVVTTPVSLSIEMPLGLENIVLSNAKAVFTNVTTNETFIQEQFQEKMVALWHLLPMCLKEHTMLPSAVT